MDEERVKSAFEIAMERISGLPDLTPEEIAAQKAKEYAPFGEAIAAKYLSGFLNDGELAAELDKYQGGRQEIVRRALMAGLCRTIQLEEEPETVSRALKGMERMAPEKRSRIAAAATDFQSILRQYEQVKKEKSCQFGAVESKKMADLGISGSAVRSNLTENEDWEAELKAVQQPYESILEAIRSRLLQ